MIRYLLLPPACLVGLSACAAKTPPPAIAPPPVFAAATLQTDKVAPPTPASAINALPPMRVLLAAPKPRAVASPPTLHVRSANRAATREPVGHGYIDAIQVYPYAEGALFRLYAAPEQISDIALQPGETLTAIAAGDTVRWVVGDTTSGSGPTKRTHILVKPTAPGLKTNLVITTDRRSYHLVLESTSGIAMAALSWNYPQDELIALRGASAAAETVAPIASGLAVDALRFGYAISGDSPAWRPLRAFDDGRQVFIEFPGDIGVGEAPPLFVLGDKGHAELVNYRMRGRYYIVDRLFSAAELRLGEKPQSVVRIEHDDGQRRRHGRGKRSVS